MAPWAEDGDGGLLALPRLLRALPRHHSWILGSATSSCSCLLEKWVFLSFIFFTYQGSSVASIFALLTHGVDILLSDSESQMFHIHCHHAFTWNPYLYCPENQPALKYICSKICLFFWADCMTKSHINGRKMVTIKSHLFKKLCLCIISSTPSSSIIRYVCIIILSLTDSVVFLIQWAPLSSPDVSNHDNHHHEKTMISESTT